MKPFFDTEEKRRNLVAVARGWLGTPFHAKGRVKGAGVDCIGLWAEILRETGHLKEYTFPDYRIDAGNHLERSQIIDWLVDHPGFIEVSGPPFEPGDILAYSLRVAHHVAGCLTYPHGLHVMAGSRVVEMRIDDQTFTRRFVAAFRPVTW